MQTRPVTTLNLELKTKNEKEEKNSEFLVHSSQLLLKGDPEYPKTATKLYMHAEESALVASAETRIVDGTLLFSKKHSQKNSLEKELVTFCKVLFPRPIVYRLADINSREFAIELKVIQTIREKKGVKNLWIMFPFARTVQELREIKEKIIQAGLHRSPTCKFWFMLEIPSHVIELERVISVGIDGVCVNANNISRLLRGTEKDTSIIDKQTEATLWTYAKVIKTSHKYGITSCFYKDSLYPEVLNKLIRLGITSLSVSPHVIERTRKLISEAEKKVIQ
ncbi:MAG: hypothetical protein E6H10_19065 [Bacteroidetes bacterium]|nr:MAG: hypothetical protein E6H10_19065 [Bacteroidota bacterium]